jgi:hypothetical protein
VYAIHTKTLILLLAAALMPAGLIAQQQPMPSPEVQGWLAEAQQIQQRLAPIHARAMEDQALQQAELQLNEAILAELRRAGPAVQADLRRIETIQPELRAAQEAGNREQLERLVTEAQQLQMRLAQAQGAALQQPEIQARAQAYQTQLQARMVELDPAAETMIQRLMALQAQILEAMGNGTNN